MKEKYRSASISHFKDGAAHLLALFLLGLAMVVWIVLVVLLLFLLYMVLNRLSISVDLSAEIIASAFAVLIALPLLLSAGLDMAEIGGFEATLSEVTFHVLFLKRTFRFSEIDDIQVETRYIVQHYRRHVSRFFAEKITISCGGKKRSFYARMDCNVDSIIREKSGQMMNEMYGSDRTAADPAQYLTAKNRVKSEGMLEERLKNSRFHKLKKFIEENQKYV